MVDHCLPADHANGYPPATANIGPTAMLLVGQWWPHRVLLSGERLEKERIDKTEQMEETEERTEKWP